MLGLLLLAQESCTDPKKENKKSSEEEERGGITFICYNMKSCVLCRLSAKVINSVKLQICATHVLYLQDR